MDLPPIDTPSARLWERFVACNDSGLRSDAADAMATFIGSLTTDDRLLFTRWFCRRRYGRRRANRMRSHLMPLARDVVVPVLIEGARQSDRESLRWLVHAALADDMRTDVIAPQLHDRSRPAGLLAVALARNPEAPDLWRIAFHFELALAEWGAHHLGEGVLLLAEQDCVRSIERARRVSERAPGGALSADDLEDLEVLSESLADYRAWSETGSAESFPDWC